MRQYPFRAIAFLCASALVFSLFTLLTFGEDEVSVSARSAALYEPKTGTFLYKKRQDERLGMASTTKIMTALLALESPDPERLVTIGPSAVGVEGSSLYLKEGEVFSLFDLTVGLLLRSANDAAIAIAEAVSGSVFAFVGRMNERARQLGLSDTHFDNPHGLDGDTHYTTAHDLALLAAAALENEAFRSVTSMKRAVVGEGESARPVVNHNKMLRTYDGAVGVKTGYTKKCGRCLVSAAERDGLTLIAVTLDAPDDWRDHTRMLDYGFGTLENVTLAEVGEISFEIGVIGKEDPLPVANEEEFSVVLPRGARERVACEISLPRLLPAPIAKGEVLGHAKFTLDGDLLADVPLVAGAEAAAEKPSFFQKIFGSH